MDVDLALEGAHRYTVLVGRERPDAAKAKSQMKPGAVQDGSGGEDGVKSARRAAAPERQTRNTGNRPPARVVLAIRVGGEPATNSARCDGQRRRTTREGIAPERLPQRRASSVPK